MLPVPLTGNNAVFCISLQHNQICGYNFYFHENWIKLVTCIRLIRYINRGNRQNRIQGQKQWFKTSIIQVINSVISASSLQILSVLLQRQSVLFTGLGGWEFIIPGMFLRLSYLQLFSLFLWYNADMTHDAMKHFVESKGKWAVHLSVSVLAASHLVFQQEF